MPGSVGPLLSSPFTVVSLLIPHLVFGLASHLGLVKQPGSREVWAVIFDPFAFLLGRRAWRSLLDLVQVDLGSPVAQVASQFGSGHPPKPFPLLRRQSNHHP